MKKLLNILPIILFGLVGFSQTANFQADDSIVCLGTTVNFLNLSDGGNSTIQQSIWNFGDGTYGTSYDEMHVYSDSGTYNVTLTIINANGQQASISKLAYIKVNAPSAKFSTYYANVETDKACNPSSLPVEFTIKYAQSIVQDPAKTDIVQMHWFWGDGTDTLMLNNYIDNSLPSYKHKFYDYGTYNVTQTITNFTTGCTDSISHEIHVSWVTSSISLLGNDSICRSDSLEIKDLSESFGSHPLNNWTYTITTFDPGTYPLMPAPGPAGVPVLLNGLYANMITVGDTYYANDTMSYQFNNTDWIVSSQHAPFSVYLVAYNSVGCSSVPSDTINVHVFQPAIVIGSSDLIGCTPLYDSLFNHTCLLTTNPLPIVAFVWHFPNEIDSVVTFPASPADYCDTLIHTFFGEGNVEVTLTATDAFGCKNTTGVQINFLPELDITINGGNQDTICIGESITLNATGGETYEWSNGVSNGDTFFPTTSESYTVTGTNIDGCMDIDTLQIITNNPPIVNAGNDIIMCLGDSVTLNATGANTYEWSNGVSNGSTFTPIVLGDYFVTGYDVNGCIGIDTLSLTFPVIQTQNLCVVGVDSASNNIRVVWEKPISSAIDSFFIYRETSIANNYEKVGAVDYDSLSIWLDLASNPNVQAFRYKISALDTCFSETTLSEAHKTIHLTINQGINNSWNLIWSQYEGITFDSYRIYRGSSPNSLSLLTTIQSNLNSYTDLTPPSGNLYYQIEIVNPNNCNPTKSVNYSNSKSNIADINSSYLSEFTNSQFKIIPNPYEDYFHIQLKSFNDEIVFLKVFDLLGEIVEEHKIQPSEVDLLQIGKGLANGEYTIQIIQGDKLINDRLIKH